MTSISRDEIASALRKCRTDNPGLPRLQLRKAQRDCIIAYLKTNASRIGGINPDLQPVQNPTTGWPVVDAILEDLDSYPDYVQ